jgi:hypothetical protein
MPGHGLAMLVRDIVTTKEPALLLVVFPGTPGMFAARGPEEIERVLPELATYWEGRGMPPIFTLDGPTRNALRSSLVLERRTGDAETPFRIRTVVEEAGRGLAWPAFYYDARELARITGDLFPVEDVELLLAKGASDRELFDHAATTLAACDAVLRQAEAA